MGRRPSGMVLAVGLVATLVGCVPGASRGTMPPPGPGGLIDPSSVPDFVAVVGDGPDIVGYARRDDVRGASDNPFPVFGNDLRTIVGQMVPGKGFVRAGVDPNAVPNIPVVVGPAAAPPQNSSNVVLYVRNGSASMINTALIVHGSVTTGAGFWAQYTGAECETMASGDQLALLDRSLTDVSARITRVLYTRGSEPQPPQLWIDVDSAGTVAQGVGVPPWWGAPQSC